MGDGLDKFLNNELVEPYVDNYPTTILCDLGALGIDPQSLSNPRPEFGKDGQQADGHLNFSATFSDAGGNSRDVNVQIVDWASQGAGQTRSQRAVADYGISVMETDAEPIEFPIETNWHAYPRTQITRKGNTIELKSVPEDSGPETVFYRAETGLANIYNYELDTEAKGVDPFNLDHGLSEGLRNALEKSLSCGFF